LLKLNQIFLLQFIFIFSITLLVSAIISYFTLKSLELTQYEKHISNDIDFLIMQISKERDLDELVQRIKEQTAMRATILSKEGTVIAESHHDKESMDNHLDREEIIQAMKSGEGSSVRFSETTKDDRLYIAKQMVIDDEVFYIRLSSSLALILDNFFALWVKVTLLFAFFIFVGMIINYRVSKRIAFDLGILKSNLEQIAQKSYKLKDKASYTREFSVISHNIEKLASKLQKRDKQKQKHTAKLRLMNKQRNMMLSSMAHEFKNPIASMIGYAETLHNDPNCKGDVRERFLQKIVDNGEKINTMLDRMTLSISLDNEDFQYHRSLFDLNVVVSDAVLDMEKKYRDRKIVYSGQKVNVYADKTLLELAVVNLIDNALKYSHEDIEVTLDEKSFHVKDYGIGIEEAELDKITKKFYRIYKNRWDNSMGLGLAIVSFILKAHNSSLNIESVENEGSTFSFSVEEITKDRRTDETM